MVTQPLRYLVCFDSFNLDCQFDVRREAIVRSVVQAEIAAFEFSRCISAAYFTFQHRVLDTFEFIDGEGNWFGDAQQGQFAIN